MRATIWPVLGTIAWYYAHDKRQRGHGEVTLPPLVSRKERLGAARCTMRSPGANKDRLPPRLFTLLSFPHKETRTPPLFIYTHTHTHTCAQRACTKANAETVCKRVFVCTWWGRGSGLPRACENLPTFLVARAKSVRARNFGGEVAKEGKRKRERERERESFW